MVQQNPFLESLGCIRCGALYDPGDPQVDRGLGCLTCLDQGYPASLALVYQRDQAWTVNPSALGMARYTAHLPYLDIPNLGEGGTPLVELPGLARTLGVGQLWVKNEGQNPTGSHKDRMSPLAVARAVSLGKDTVVAASSGNAGASLAAYASAAGMRCVIISTAKISSGWRRAIEAAGAELLLTDTPKARWVLMRERIENEGWYPVTNYLDPPVGSNPFGVDGYKSTGYEILEACGDETPTVILVPTSRGDLLWGLWQGFQDGVRFGLAGVVPRLVAVEPAPRLSMVLRDADYRQTFPEEPHAMVSIGGGTVTYQAMRALRNTEGCAVEVSMEEALRAQAELAGHGFFAELSAAASLAGLRVLIRRDEIKPPERVVLVITSHGYKDPPIGG